MDNLRNIIKGKVKTSTSQPPISNPISMDGMINGLPLPELYANHASSSNLLLPTVDSKPGTSTVEHGESSKKEQCESSKKEQCRLLKTVRFGQEDDFDEVCNFLKETDVGMVGIYGMGGVGKTTLLTRVSNELLRPSNFKVIWIVVSKTVLIGNIQRSIMRELNLSFDEEEHPISRGININETLYNRSSCSHGSPIALLLDDIWEAIDLEELGVAGGRGLNPSMFKIIFTTRSQDVCLQMEPDRMIKIKCLGMEDSWSLFNGVVGKKTLCSHHRIAELAKKVANECGGLPLALTVVGKAMVSKTSVEAWEDALSNLRSRPSLVSGIESALFERLKFSYDNLENEVERECFLFCCMYPEDRGIKTEELIECWIGEGIFDVYGYDTYQKAYNRGRSIVDTLLAKSMLEKYNDKHVKIHDVIRDMGIWIGSEKKLFFLPETGIAGRWAFIDGLVPESYHSYCPSWSVLHIRQEILSLSLPFMPKLKVLILDSRKTPTIVPLMFEHLTELRYLKIRNYGLILLPLSVKNLTKLRVLELCNYLIELRVLERCINSDIQSLPTSLGGLCDLRKLSIRGLTAIPGSFEKLTNLEIVEISPVGEIRLGMFNWLTNLRKLRLNDVRSMHWEMLRLNKLEELAISIFPEEGKWGENNSFFMKDIIDLPSLGHLEIDNWSIVDDDEMITTLKTMHKLHFLSISSTPLSQFIIPSGERAFHCLDYLILSSCPYLKNVNGLQHLQQLRKLEIKFLEQVEECLLPDLRGDCMPNLRVLDVFSIEKMKRICDDDVVFPLLSVFKLAECPMLEKLPRGLMKVSTTLEGEIKGELEWWNGLDWGDDDFKSSLTHLFRYNL